METHQTGTRPFRYYDSKAKIQYCVVNDAQNLYICLKTSDDKAQMKILRTGMDVTLNTSGKKKETSTVRYPLPGDTKLEWITDPAEPDQQHLERPDLKKLKTDYSLSDKEMILVGFKGIPATKMPIENKYGIQIAIGWDKNDVFTYELKVPFSAFYKDVLTASDTLNAVNIVVKVNSFDVPQQISNGSVTDPSSPNAGMRNQSGNNASNAMYGGGQGTGMQGAQSPAMSMSKVNDMSLTLQVPMKMKFAFK